jgi:hypothetical protein
VLFYVARPVHCPSNVTVLDPEGKMLSSYPEFSLLA